MSDTSMTSAPNSIPSRYTDVPIVISFADPKGDAKLDEQVLTGASLIFLVIFLGLLFAIVLFCLVYRYDRWKREQEQLKKIVSSCDHAVATTMTATPGSGSPTTLPQSASSYSGTGALDAQTIEEGLILQTWGAADTHPDTIMATSGNGITKNKEAKDYSSFDSNDTEDSTETTTTSVATVTPPPVCPICNKPFVSGELVCSSYNPHCGHSFHKQCMFNWLEYQNRCPVCNETYLSQQQA